MTKSSFLLVCVFILLIPSTLWAQKNREIYLLTVYHFATTEQEKAIDNYLQSAYIPALHKKGLKNIGAFKWTANDTASDKRIYVLVPLNEMNQLPNLASGLMDDQQHQQSGKDYLDAPYNNTPYVRMENVILKAFSLAPKMKLPKLNGPKAERIFELRSYESATEKLYRNKVEMFNEGGEIKLFERLNFNAIFYGEVLSGSRMPNLMYMTSFENKADRDAHWKTFVDDPEWKRLSALPKYQKNVSRIEIMLLTPTGYSDY